MQNVRQIVSCPYEEGRYFLLVEDGEIFSSKIEGSAGRIDRHCLLARSLDAEKHPLNQQPAFLAFLRMVPPALDTEIMEHNHDPDYPAFPQRRLLAPRHQLLTVGGARGSVLFLSIHDLSSLYCRVSYHRERVVAVQEVTSEERQEEWLLSLCEQRLLKLVVFVGGRACCLSTWFVGDGLLWMQGYQELLALVLRKGVFEVVSFACGTGMVVVNPEAVNHDEEILSLDFRPDSRLFLTSSQDHRIKVWTAQKVLLYDIVADEALRYALWGHQDQLLLFVSSKLYVLRDALALNPIDLVRLEKERREEYGDLEEDQLPLADYLREALRPRVSPLAPPRYPSQPESPRTREQRVASTVVRGEKSARRRRLAVRTEQSPQRQPRAEDNARAEQDLKALRRHMEELSSIKRAAQETVLPRLKPRSEDVFVEFMREKLLNKKLLTRRDITLNRIIMKNIIKDHLGDYEKGAAFKLE